MPDVIRQIIDSIKVTPVRMTSMRYTSRSSQILRSVATQANFDWTKMLDMGMFSLAVIKCTLSTQELSLSLAFQI